MGNLHQLNGGLMHHVLRDMAKKYGPLIHLKFGEVSNIVVSSPEVAKEIFKTHDVLFAHRPTEIAAFRIMTYNFSDILFSPFGSYWRQLRKICTVNFWVLGVCKLFDCQDIFGAGGDTSAASLEWAISETIKNPRILKRAQEEVRNLFRDKGNVEESSLDQLKYLQAIIKETMRLHPSAPLSLPRECSEQCNVYGYDIPAKTRVLVNIWAIGRDPKYWTEPDIFNPDRFLDSQVDYRGNDFEYIPFGAGRRICPGMSFAIPNIALPLAQLLFHFYWKLPDEKNLEDLDMVEGSSLTVRLKNELKLIYGSRLEQEP